MITSMTQMAYPLITGGKPILSLPPMAVVMYEGTMLGAILFTVLGVIFESRLPHKMTEAYDERISQGFIGVLVRSEEGKENEINDILAKSGAVDTKIA